MKSRLLNVILVVSDTLRRDHLPIYADTDVRAPNLTAFAQQALVFDNCYPSSFPTVPARADLMTGRYTFTYLPWGPLPQNEVTLARTLAQAGYATAAIADTPFVARNGYGFDRGFLDFIYVRGQLHGTERDYRQMHRGVSEAEGYCAAKTFQEAVGWLEQHHKRPFFLCRHLGPP
ncbi:MAG: sulfatase-like hydrolase/transferase [Chloroflexi bacterium]|nr:sulfatase-like hydrolase/transferase [Chloroflexota bacterium]